MCCVCGGRGEQLYSICATGSSLLLDKVKSKNEATTITLLSAAWKETGQKTKGILAHIGHSVPNLALVSFKQDYLMPSQSADATLYTEQLRNSAYTVLFLHLSAVSSVPRTLHLQQKLKKYI